MAQKEPDTGPSLELPSLFGRRKRRGAAEGDTTTVAPADETVTQHAPDPVVEAEAPDQTAVIPVVEDPVVEEPVVEEPVDDQTVVHEPVVPEPVAQAPVVHEPVAQEPVVHEPAPQPAIPAATPTAVPQPIPVDEDDESDDSEPDAEDRPKRSVPELAATTAAFLVGAAIGLMGCVLTFIGLQGCELVTGTGSCGGPGLLVLVVILAVMIIAGAAALRAFKVPEPGNVSFLGVGIMTAIALLFLIDYLYDLWMLAVVPVLTSISYAVARWITTLYADDLDDDDRGMPHVDIR